MLPEFAQVKQRRQRMLMEFLMTQTHAESQLTASLRTFRQHEGRDALMRDLEGQEQHIEFDQVLSSKMEIPHAELPELTNQRIAQKLMQMAKDLGSQKDRQFLQMLKKTIAESGNVIKRTGRLSPQHFEEVTREMPIDFDEYGNPEMPSLLVGTDMYEELQQRIPEWEANPENKRRMDAILEEKRVEWRDREADRKLVD